MNLAPKPRFLASIRAERGDIVRLCGEAVDNSFDALARHISIAIAEHEIKFVDDGIGVRLERFPALFTIGDHIQLTSTKLGRFGVGITMQALNVSDVLEVRSVSSDGHFMSRVNWRDILRSGWDQPNSDPIRLPIVVGTPTGTIIKLTGVRKLRPFAIEKLIEDLAQRFYPALADGRTITVNGGPVPLFSDPSMIEIVEQQFEFSNGRTAMLRAGLLSNPSKTNMNRVHVAFGHRVIMPASTVGCGKYTGLSNMFARIQLDGSAWALSTFKDDLTNEDQREELDEAVELAMLPILEKCSTVSMKTRISSIGELINHEILSPALAGARRPHRIKPKTGTGGKRKTKTPGVVDPNKSDEGGPVRTKRAQRDQLIVTFEGRNSEHGTGWFEPGRPNRVNLSPDNPRLAKFLRLKDDRTVAEFMALVAITLFEQGRDSDPNDPRLQLEPFGVRVARHLEVADDAVTIQGQAGA